MIKQYSLRTLFMLKRGFLFGLLLLLMGSAYAACQVSSGDGCSFDSHTWTFVTENRLPETIQSITPQDAGTQLSYTVKTPDTCHKLDNGGFKIDGISGGTTCKLGVHVKKGKAEGKVNIQLASGSAFNAAYKLPQPPHLKIIPNGETFKPGQHAHFQIKNQGGDMGQPVVIHRPDSLPKSVVQISDNTCQNNKLGEGDRCHVGIGAVSGVKDKYKGHFSVCAGQPCDNDHQLDEIKVGVKPQSIQVKGPSSKPFLGENFQVKVTNQSSSPIKPAINDIPNGIERVNNGNNTCYGQTIKGGDSCHFVLRADSTNLETNSVQIQVKDRNDNVFGSKTGAIDFKQPQFEVTAEPDQSFYHPGQSVKVKVTPTAGAIYMLKATHLQNLTQQSTTCQGDKQSQSCQYTFQVPDEPQVGKQAKITFKSHYADDSQIQKAIAGFKLTAQDTQDHYTNKPLQLTVTTQSSQELTGIAPKDLPGGIDKLDSGKDRCQGTLKPSEGSCHIYLQANDQLNNPSQVKSIKIGADHAQTKSQPVSFKEPIKLALLNKSPKLGQKFKLSVTNESGNKVKHLKLNPPKGVKVLPQGCNAQDTLAAGSSCQFHLQVKNQPSKPDQKKTLTVISDHGRSISSSFKIQLPQLKVSLNPSGQLPIGRTLTVTVQSKSGDASLNNIHYTDLKNLKPQGDKKQCDTVDPGDSCVFKFKPKASSAGDKGHMTITSQYVQSKQISVPIGKMPHIKLVSAPFFTEPSRQSFIIKNTANSGIAIINHIKREYKPDLGHGVSCTSDLCGQSNISTFLPMPKVDSAQSSQIKECGSTLKPNTQCKVTLRADQQAWGTTLFKINGQFKNSPLQVPVNVRNSRLVVKTSSSGHQDATNWFAYQMGLDNGAIPAWNGPLTKGPHLNNYPNEYSEPEKLKLVNQGPFNVKPYQPGKLKVFVPNKHGYSNHCDHILNRHDSCDIQFGRTLWPLNFKIRGMLNIFNQSTYSEPLVSLPVFHHVCGWVIANNNQECDKDKISRIEPSYSGVQLIRKAPDIAGHSSGKFSNNQSFYPMHLTSLPGYLFASLSTGSNTSSKIPLKNPEGGDIIDVKPHNAPIIKHYKAQVNCFEKHTWQSKCGLNPDVLGCPFSMQFEVDPYAKIGSWQNRNQKIVGFNKSILSHYNDRGRAKSYYPFAVMRKLVVGGDFTHIKGVPNTTAIAAYGPILGGDKQWQSLGVLSAGDSVNALVMGRDLYAGGQFSQISYKGLLNKQANNIARYNGVQWKSLGKGITNQDNSKPAKVNAMTLNDGALYVGGQFSQAGDQKGVSNLAYWDNNTWQGIDNELEGSANVAVNALLVTHDQQDANKTLWVGGNIKSGVAFVNLNPHKFKELKTTSGLKPLSDNHNAIVNSLTYDKDRHKLIAGGQFKVCHDGRCGYGLAVRDLSADKPSWKPFHAQADGAPIVTSDMEHGGIDSVLYFDATHAKDANADALLVGGTFYTHCTPDNCDKSNIRHSVKFDYNSKQWSSLFSKPISGGIKAQVYNKDNIFLGGRFSKFKIEPDADMDIAKLYIKSNILPQLQSLQPNDRQKAYASQKQILGGSIKAMTFMNNIKAAPKVDPERALPRSISPGCYVP